MKRIIQRYKNDVVEWWKITADDVLWANHDFEGGFYTQTCFISQQIAEKALKTFLLSQNVIVEKTHKLPSLIKQANRNDKSFIAFKPHVKILDRYYFTTRYPTFGGPKGEYTKEEAEHALKLAKEIVDFVGKKLDV